MPFSCKLFFILLVFTQAARAQNSVGNGGNVVDCKGKKPVLLDFYEAKVTPFGTGKDSFEIAKAKFEKLATVAPELGKQYLKKLERMPVEIEFTEDKKLATISDSKHLFEPLDKNCKVTQIAIRNNKVVSGEKQFLFRKDLWEKMEPTQQAGLVAHEIIYEHLSKLGETDSIKARKINATVFKENYDRTEFWKLIKELEVPIYP